MFQAGDVFVARLPCDYYGAIRILKAGVQDYTEEEFNSLKITERDGYLIAVTSYFDKEMPQLTDPRLKKTATCKYTGQKQINVYSGYKYSDKIIKQLFEYLGNLPPTDEEKKMRMRIPTPDDRSGFSGGWIDDSFIMKTFYVLASEDVQSAYEEERKSVAKSEIYRYQDDEKDEFWLVEYGGNNIVYLSGNTGGIPGKMKHKAFKSKEECDKEVKKLIAAKIKEGYILYPDYYRDDDSGKIRFDKDEKSEN